MPRTLESRPRALGLRAEHLPSVFEALDSSTAQHSKNNMQLNKQKRLVPMAFSGVQSEERGWRQSRYDEKLNESHGEE